MKMHRPKEKEDITKDVSKKTYLANMSHEIRTPMNAIIGLSDILLRESKDPNEKEHLNSMQSAVNNLLMTINNILDYEDMLDGKISLNPDAYETESLLEEIIDIAKINVSKKQVLFLVDCSANIPSRLYGDAARIKQVIVHLLSNAEKFTRSGFIKLSVGYKRDGDDALLDIKVIDTGVGIKKEGMEEITKAFTQADDSTTRYEGGLGIGLTIAKALLNMMGSEMKIESEEHKGTTISFTLRNRIVDDAPAGVINGTDKYHVAIFLQDKEEERTVHQLLNDLGVSNMTLTNVGELFVEHDRRKFTHLIVNHTKYLQMKDIQELRALNVRYLVGVDYATQIVHEQNADFYRKPLWFSEFAKVIKGEGKPARQTKETLSCIGNRILIVDDNDINLRVTAGLLKPYGIQVDTATNADDGIRLVTKTKYDLVFMDHMMPGIDGVEATKIIRQHDEPYYKSLPIIALSANAINGVEALFLQAGMNDFLAKPVQIAELEAMLKKWLPKDKVKTAVVEVIDEAEDAPVFKGFKSIDVNLGLSYTNGDAKMYTNIVNDFAATIKKKKENLNALSREEDVGRFTIDVHALKSSAKTIGALQLSEVALELERMGHARDVDAIKKNIGRLNEAIDNVIIDLLPLENKTEAKQKKMPVDKERLREELRELFYAADDFDYDAAAKIITAIGNYDLTERLDKLQKEMHEFIENIDYDAVTKKAVEMLALLDM